MTYLGPSQVSESKKYSFIGIHGRAQSGKDTVADEVCRTLNLHGVNTLRSSFAGPVKTVAADIYGLPEWMFSVEEYKAQTFFNTKGKTLREILVLVGQGLRQILGSDIWISRLDARSFNYNGTVVVPDIRDEEELEYLTGKGAFLIKLRRNVPSSATGLDMEDELPDNAFDLVIDNQDMTKLDLVNYLASLDLGELLCYKA